MPNCFQLYRKGDPSAEAVLLHTVDEEMCQHFQVPVSKENWCGDWYNLIGYELAAGRDWNYIRQELAIRTSESIAAEGKGGYGSIEYYMAMTDVVDWMEENFGYRNWVEIGSRNEIPQN